MSLKDSPLTRFICDVLKHRMGTMTKDEIRTNWTKGKYKGVCPKRAKWEMEW